MGVLGFNIYVYSWQIKPVAKQTKSLRFQSLSKIFSTLFFLPRLSTHCDVILQLLPRCILFHCYVTSYYCNVVTQQLAFASHNFWYYNFCYYKTLTLFVLLIRWFCLFLSKWKTFRYKPKLFQNFKPNKQLFVCIASLKQRNCLFLKEFQKLLSDGISAKHNNSDKKNKQKISCFHIWSAEFPKVWKTFVDRQPGFKTYNCYKTFSGQTGCLWKNS